MALRDVGLQFERTSLAWSRTALAMLVNTGLLLRSAITEKQESLVYICLGIGAASIFLASFAIYRSRKLKKIDALFSLDRFVMAGSCGAILVLALSSFLHVISF